MLKAIGHVLLFPFFVVVAAATLIGVSVIVAIQSPRVIASRIKWKSRLRNQSRYMIPMDGPVTGTLIVDSPSVGCNISHCWWSPDDIRTASPFPIPNEIEREFQLHSQTDKLHLDFDEWCYETYISIDTGRAILLAIRDGDSFAKSLRENYPELDLVESWSGPVAEFGPDIAG